MAWWFQNRINASRRIADDAAKGLQLHKDACTETNKDVSAKIGRMEASHGRLEERVKGVDAAVQQLSTQQQETLKVVMRIDGKLSK